MNDLIFITAHCPTIEQEVSLERCVDSILRCGFHVALISHTHIPIHIQKKCNYYVYDYKNDTSDDSRLMGFSSFTIIEGCFKYNTRTVINTYVVYHVKFT